MSSDFHRFVILGMLRYTKLEDWCLKTTNSVQSFIRRARTHAVKISHSHAHSSRDLPPTTCVIHVNPYLKMLLTQIVLLLLTF